MPAFTLQAAECPSVLLAVAVCPLLSVRCGSLKTVSPLLFSWHPRRTPCSSSRISSLVWFATLQRFVCLGIINHNKIFDLE